MNAQDLQIIWRDPRDLTPYHANAKAHPTEQIDKIAASIAEFNFDQPLVVDEQGVIIKGHGRREAAIRLGLDKVPVLVRGDLSEARKKALRIADNRVAESAWLEDVLQDELLALQEQDYDLGLTGFDADELARLLPDDEPPAVEFKAYDESVARDVKQITCPHCGKSFAA